ncbi:CCHC-type domain-containing protein [Trichonephila clavipes]|nr:CCHC-type domain-containing protein [Trichonephila clavipes]
MEFYHHLPSWDMNEKMPYFSSVSDKWSRDLKSVRYRNSVHVEEEEAKKLLEVITAERLETEQRQKLEQQEQLSIEKLRLEMELSRIANQSATQNNGQTSRVKSLDEIVKICLEKAFASEMVSDELKPKVLLCMLEDKVSNLLVNLGEEELKDYESLKQVVLKEYEPSPKICLENFRKAKRKADETFSQFASRLTSMWLYYCKLREANDFESVNQLIVADKMFEMLDSETVTHIGVLQGEEWYKPRDLGKQYDIFYASKGKSYDEPERAKWNDSEKKSFNGSWGKQPFGEKKSDNFSSRKNFDKGQVTEIKNSLVSPCGSDKHFKRDCPKNKEVDNKRLDVNKVSTEGTELEDGTVTARVDLLDGKLVHALLASGTEITVIKKDLVPGISVEGDSTIYLKGIFGPAVKCPLVYVPIGLATGGQVNVVHQQVLCALAEVLVEDVLLPPEVLDMLGGAQSEENSLAQSSQDLRVDSGNVDETEVSLGILPEKAQEHIEDSQRNITSCRNEVGTLGTKDEEVTAEMDKGIMVADSFRSEQECCAELALYWATGNSEVQKNGGVETSAYFRVFSSHMGPKKTLERIEYSFFWEGLRSNVKKFCESCKECQLTRSVGRVRNSCLHLATGQTRDDIEKRIWQRRRRKRSERERRESDGKSRAEKIELREDLKSRRGLAVSLEIICHNCEESTSTMSSKISNKCYNVNLRLTYGMRAIGKVNGDRYRALIINFFIPELNNHDVQELWFQQDGATCHTARATIDLLKDTFGDRLIPRFGPVNWPPRSCDLTPLDYFLWGYVKSLVYANKPQTLDHLEDNIRHVIADIRPQMLEKVIEN